MSVIPLHPVRDPASLAKPKHIFMLQFDIVRGCQLRCLGCPTPVIEPKVYRIPVEDFSRCLANIDVERIAYLRLYREGEPLLHRQLASLVAEIPKQRWKASIVEISTNAQWVDWAQFEEAMRLEVVNRLVVSCDGDGTPEEYERLRPPSKWEKFMEFLERARVIRDRWAPAMHLGTRTIVRTRTDAERWEGILRPMGWTPEFRRWMALAGGEGEPHGTRGRRAPRPLRVRRRTPRSSSHKQWFGEMNQLYVDGDGTVVPCCIHPHAAVLGDLKTELYSDILRGERRRELLARMDSSRATMSVCGVCDVGPVGNEGPSYWSTFAYWNPEKPELPEG